MTIIDYRTLHIEIEMTKNMRLWKCLVRSKVSQLMRQHCIKLLDDGSGSEKRTQEDLCASGGGRSMWKKRCRKQSFKCVIGKENESTEYDSHLLTEYDCRWNNSKSVPKVIENPKHYTHPFESKQSPLFDPLWVREPIQHRLIAVPKKVTSKPEQMRLYLGPELVRVASR